MVCFSDYPEVPKDLRPKPLFIETALDAKEKKTLLSKGWQVIDLRLLPCRTDAERADAVKAKLEAIRMGTVPTLDREQLVALQVEARLCGLLATKSGVAVESTVEDGTIEELLSFSNKRSTSKVHVHKNPVKVTKAVKKKAR